MHLWEESGSGFAQSTATRDLQTRVKIHPLSSVSACNGLLLLPPPPPFIPPNNCKQFYQKSQQQSPLPLHASIQSGPSRQTLSLSLSIFVCFLVILVGLHVLCHWCGIVLIHKMIRWGGQATIEWRGWWFWKQSAATLPCLIPLLLYSAVPKCFAPH